MTRCSECPESSHHAAPFFGPSLGTTSSHPSVLFIGDRPIFEYGRLSLISSQTFIEFSRTYLPLARLEYSSIALTNAVCCTDGSKHKPSDRLVLACASNHIPQEIEQCQPTVIVLLGATACSLAPEIQLDRDHGLPLSTSSSCFSGWSGILIPMYHPALGLKSTEKMIPLLEDFERLGEILRGAYSHEISPARTWPTDYAAADAGLIEHELSIPSKYQYLPIDSEDDQGRAFSLQYSLYPGHGRIVLLDQGREAKLAAFQRLVDKFSGVTMHNAPHDLAVMDELGLKISQFRDTMQEAYHLGNLPQGLKALAWRLMAARMQSWEDLVTPYAKRLLQAWLIERIVECEPEIEKVMYKRPLKRRGIVTDHKLVVKLSAREKVLTRIYKHGFAENSSAATTYDVWEKLEEYDLIDSVEPTPRRSIAHCPMNEIVAYGCGDADQTGQLAEVLTLFRRQLSEGDWAIPESDWDK